ncbi:MAG: tRNA (adenosine(37)-N6)-dimethylallyltransferase MiaA [Flavobacteriaceae bacterium CG_4_8_14_3_um_filter_34_10]|nr:tRNA (adenosine(37)-N6)-dimethylallyltransferase MiaA [Flavobacteriia bacterium]OIP51697.1 MAG: tRNA (adenosine(37)-N6)-dimethylallyltransferase MiaA [Flavobacteriaceae bacterium CG2_30_34_30]PIQ19118.1 MAG: tRNA (adenosine(37)-N6)-dimethylallyltransferase MiaA [Flavobacteriaceae bacterium CG18_big_fil_WC_8_21_14_2_50_34_36]PIV50952.1 MAG: tRNA (adenosine(37)-N6)-dimethylallyltransferase MiaA [Flavobacteriaceae bacterium CG02_land_8_20_14_3_00_34_13]PIX09282.1 MAG: tRNA (adenosine(37)-N6)-di
MANKKKHLIVLVGPTAIGKTALSVALAKHFKSEIISADSRQFYKEMSIGTAIPSQEELLEIPHHFIHHISVEQEYNVGAFERDALQLLEEKFQTNDLLFMVGGSGLYIQAVVEGLDTFPKIDPKIRKKLSNTFQENGITFLQKELLKLDFAYYQKVDIQNAQRLIRALEICIGTGKPYSSFLNKNNPTIRNFECIKIGLTADRNLLYNRINQRVDAMMNAGLLNEVEQLLPKKDLNALQTVGYRELFSYFNAEIPLDIAIEEIKKNTRRYAKRQLTWFRKEEEIKWFNFQTPYEEIITHIKSRTI